MKPLEAVAELVALNPSDRVERPAWVLDVDAPTRATLTVRGGAIGYADRIGYVAAVVPVTRRSPRAAWSPADPENWGEVIWPGGAPSPADVMNWLQWHDAWTLRDVVASCYPPRKADRASRWACRTFVGYAYQVEHAPAETPPAVAARWRVRLAAVERLLREECGDEPDGDGATSDARRRFEQLVAEITREETTMTDEAKTGAVPGTATGGSSIVRKRAPETPAPEPAAPAAGQKEATVATTVRGTKPTAGPGSKTRKSAAKAAAKRAAKNGAEPAAKAGAKGEKKAASRMITDPSTLKPKPGAPASVRGWIAASQKLKVGESRKYEGRNEALSSKTVRIVGFLPDGGVYVEHDGRRFTSTPYSLGVPKPAKDGGAAKKGKK